MLYGQFCMYSFYEEVAEYNKVNAGVIEISFNGDGKTYTNSAMIKEESFDNTAV